MNTVLVRYVLCAMLTATAAAPAIAQDGPPPPPPGPGMGPGPGGPFMGPDDMGRHRAPVTGLPYTATTVTEMTQTLADGNRISRKTEGRVMRDSAGRTRREHTLTGLGPMAAGPENTGRAVVMIDDPVAQTRYVLDPEKKIARQMPGFASRGAGAGAGFGRGKGAGRADANGERPKPLEESLGTKTIEGLEAQGTRRTMTIPAGQIGNDQPIDIVTERWFAPALQAVVLQTMSDPRVGDRSFRLTNITRNEPAAASFQVPPDYTVVQGARRPGGGKHRRSPGEAQ